MSDDNVYVTLWDANPVSSDSGDKLLSGNDIFAAPASGTPIANEYYYNTPKANIQAADSTNTAWFPTGCLITY